MDHLKSPKRFVLFAIVVSSFVIQHQVNAGDIVERLEVEPVAYFWTDDCEQITELLFEYVSNLTGEYVPRVWMDILAERLESRSADAEATQKVLAAVRILEALDDGMFEDEFVLLLKPTGGWVIASSTDCDEEEVETFAKSLGILMTPYKLTQASSLPSVSPVVRPSVVTPAKQTEVAWALFDSWVVIASDDESLSNTREQLEGGAKHPLADDRIFQRVVANLNRDVEKYPHCKVFLPSAMVPNLLDFFNIQRGFTDFRIRPDWAAYTQAFALNEFRGIGGTIVLPSAKLKEDFPAEGAFDLFALVTEPRKGPAKLIAYRDGIDFDVPAVDRTINVFVQAELKSESMHDELLKLGRAYKQTTNGGRTLQVTMSDSTEKSPKPHSLVYVEHFQQALGDNISGVTLFVDYANEYQGMPRTSYPEGWIFIESDQQEELTIAVDDALNSEQPGTWIKKDEGDGRVSWQLAKKPLESIQDANEQSTATILERTLESNRGLWERNKLDVEEQMEAVRQRLKERQDKLNAYYDDLSFYQQGKWFMPYVLQPRNKERIRSTEFHETRRRLEQLENDLEEIENFFETKACAIYAMWPEQLKLRMGIPIPELESVRITSRMRRHKEALTEDEKAGEEELEKSVLAIRNQLAARMKSMVITLEDREGGFRIVGALLSRDPNEEEEVPDSQPDANLNR